MKSLNYFLALVPAGSFVLLMVLGSFITIPFELATAAIGGHLDGETAKALGYSIVALAWSLALIGWWIRHKSLSPQLIKPGHGFKLGLGHVLLVAGHSLLLCVIFIKDLSFLLLLPVLGVLLFYATGIVLIELARDRRQPQRMDAAGG